MNAPFKQQSQPAWTRFKHGAFECTVVTDGQLHMGPPHEQFPKADRGEIDALLSAAYLPNDRMDIEQNVLVVNTGDWMVLFDSGSGVDPAFGPKTFGAGVGQAIPNLHLAGIEPAQIDIVALTHCHPDHCWGLVDGDDRPLYPNATVAVSGVDFDYWTDLRHLDAPEGREMSEHMRDHFRGAHKNLMPYLHAGRLTRLSDGQKVAPGIAAALRPGHSPGHMIYRIESASMEMVVWGDISHHFVLLLAHPEWGFTFDFDNDAAAKTRVQVFEEILAARSAVFAFHFPFPGRGHLQRTNARFEWLPISLELGDSLCASPATYHKRVESAAR